VQKGLTSKTVFELRSDSVGIEMKGLWGSKRLSVPFDSIPREPFEVSVRSRGWRFIFYMSIVVMLSTMFASNNDLVSRNVLEFWTAVALVCGLRYWFSRRHYLGFNSTPSLVFEKSKPTKAQFDAFIEALGFQKAESLRTQALSMHAATPADEIHKLAWLKDLGAISETEFARLKGAVVDRDAEPEAQGRSHDPIH